MNNVKLAPPWFIYVQKIMAIFEEDPDIDIELDPDEMRLRLLVDDTDKAIALRELLPPSVKFGETELIVDVLPANGKAVHNKARLFRQAFKGNPAVTDIVNVDSVFSNPLEYIMFRKEVVQYYSDNLGDPHGNTSTLLQDIAREIFGETDGVFFCTDSEE